MEKRGLSERDICTKFITPALRHAGWDEMLQIREEVSDGEEVEDRIYNARDFDRTLVLDDRTRLVAQKVTAFLRESGDRFQKTIVFCVDQEHAA